MVMRASKKKLSLDVLFTIVIIILAIVANDVLLGGGLISAIHSLYYGACIFIFVHILYDTTKNACTRKHAQWKKTLGSSRLFYPDESGIQFSPMVY